MLRLFYCYRISILLSIILLINACRKKDALPPNPLPPTVSKPAATMILRPNTQLIGDAVTGYYAGLPSDYDSVTTKYPVLIYVPGAGQFGNGAVDLPLLLKDGPAQLIDEKKFPSTFKVNGQTFSMIVFTPQLKGYSTTYNIEAFIDFVKNNYRTDSTRIYLSGLSVGGSLSTDVASEIPNSIAAVVPMAGVSTDCASSNRCRLIAQSNLPIWTFQSADDPVFNPEITKEFIAKVNSYAPAVPAKLTMWPNGGHDAWTRALDPSYKENGFNIYEWMLQYHR